MSVSKNEQLRSLLKDTVTLMCKSVAYERDLRIEALVGVTIDSKEVILVGFNELLSNDNDSGAKCRPAGEPKMHSSANYANNGTGKDNADGKQMAANATKGRQQGKDKRSVQVKAAFKPEQVGDVIICDEPSLPKRVRDKNLAKPAKRQHRDDDLIYVGEESYSLVTGNFVKEEQFPTEPARVERRRRLRALPIQARVKMQNVQTVSHNAAVPSAGNGWTPIVQQGQAPPDLGQKRVAVRKRMRKNQYPRYSMVDTGQPFVMTQSGPSNGMVENHVNIAPDFAALMGTPISQDQCQPTYSIATPNLSAIRGTPMSRTQNQATYHITASSASSVEPVHVTTSTPVRDANHISWMTPISQTSAVSEQTAASLVGKEPQFVVLASSNMPTFTSTASNHSQDNCATASASQTTPHTTSAAQGTPVSTTSEPANQGVPPSKPVIQASPLITTSEPANQGVPPSKRVTQASPVSTTSEPANQGVPPSKRVTQASPVITTSESANQRVPPSKSVTQASPVITTSKPANQGVPPSKSVTQASPVITTSEPASQGVPPSKSVTQGTPVDQTDPVTTSAPVSQKADGSTPAVANQSVTVTRSAPAVMSMPPVSQTDAIITSEPSNQGAPPLTSVTQVTPVSTTSEPVNLLASDDTSSTISQMDPGAAGTVKTESAEYLDEPEKPNKKQRVNRGRKASPATCPVCEKVVQGVGMLRRHIKQKHPDIVK